MYTGVCYSLPQAYSDYSFEELECSAHEVLSEYDLFQNICILLHGCSIMVYLYIETLDCTILY